MPAIGRLKAPTQGHKLSFEPLGHGCARHSTAHS